MSNQNPSDHEESENRVHPDKVTDVPQEFTKQWEEIEATVNARQVGHGCPTVRLFGDDDTLLQTIAKNVAITLGEETDRASAHYTQIDLVPLKTIVDTDSTGASGQGAAQRRDKRLDEFERQVGKALEASQTEPSVLVFEHISSVPPEIQSLVFPVIDQNFGYIRQEGRKVAGNPENLVIICTQAPSGSALSKKARRLSGGRWDFDERGESA